MVEAPGQAGRPVRALPRASRHLPASCSFACRSPILTDAKGKATVTITLPERTTAWKLLAKGVTTETLAGEAEGELVVKKDLFGELKLPLAFTDGDEAEILASVHNDAVEKGAIEVTLKTTIGGKTVEEKKTLDAGKGIHEMSFKATLKRPDAKQGEGGEAGRSLASFELTVTAGELTDVVRRAVPVEPYGMPVYATAGGSATSDMTAWVEPSADMPLVEPALEVIVGANVEHSLLDVLLAPSPRCQLDSLRIASSLDSATSDLMAAIAIQRLLGATRQAGSPQAEAIDLRIRASISLLVSSQVDDGGWSWTGRGGPGNKNASNRYTSARVVWALSLARSAGYKLPDDAFEKAVAYLNGQIATTADGDYDSKAILLQGLAAAGRGDFTLANRLYRNRPSLSNAALAHLALALVQMDRQPMAGEILDVLAKRNLDDTAPKRTAVIASLPWSEAAAELRALYLLAQEKVSPEAAKTKELVEWLMSQRAGFRWSPDKATGPATLALGEWFAKTRFEGEHYQLTIVVNDVDAATLDVTQDAGTQTVQVPGRLLKPGKQKVNFRIAGRGRFTYQCVLGGFVPADKLKSTTRDWTVKRHYEPAERELDGQAVPRGFGILQGSFTTFRNPLTQLPVGQRGRVELEIWRQNVPANTTEEQLEYVVVTEPLPAGTTVIEQSIAGGFERFEIGAGTITFYVGSRHYVELESHNKWQAIYILGQVYHSLGKAADAIREYTRVEERFADAKQAIQYFMRKEITLPEVTTVKPGEAAELELKFRNVARCDARVYKIDLMKFSLLKRNLAGITGINLAGIRPYHEAAIELGDGKDYRDRSRKLPLPLKDEGAYLVVCRGDDLHASGLVLVTPLVVEVQEEAASGQVRATVKDATKDGYISDVHVKVIGTRNPDFVSGETDLRGVFVADTIQGTSTVIAEAGAGRYAFYRGTLELGPPPAAAATAPAPQPADQAPGGSRTEQLLKGLNDSNEAIQQMQGENLKKLYKRNKQRVQAMDAY